MDKVYCPWCGQIMELEHCGTDEDESFVYECPDCAARSPISYSAESALATALARPLQKPLTLEEACESDYVFCEFRDEGDVIPAKLYHANLRTNIPYIMHELLGQEECYSEEKNYGRTWRCWATKPSDEEREAAKLE